MPPLLLGFLSLYADPTAVAPPFDGGPTAIALHNPHSARSTLAIDGAPLGVVAPRGCVVIRGLTAGAHQARWTTPAGFVRTLPVVATTAPIPAESSRSCGR